MIALLVSLLVTLVSIAIWFRCSGRGDSGPSSSEPVLWLPSRADLKNCKGQTHRVSIKELFIYPVKGCKAISLSEARITPAGILYDREWMIVDDATKRFQTQRQIPRMALINAHLDFAKDELIISAEGYGEVSVPLTNRGNREIYSVQVWSDVVEAIDEGDRVSKWISKFLSADYDIPKKLRLVRFSKQTCVRGIPEKYREKENEHTYFADGFPFLLANYESLSQLNRWIKDANPSSECLPINRFRPNIVVQDTNCAFEEDCWDKISVNGIVFRVAKPCDRCIVPSTDQETGKRGKEPTITLRKFRFDGKSESVFFGQNLVLESMGSESIIRVGDGVEFSYKARFR